MKKYLSLSFVCVLCSVSAIFSQQNHIDSLESQLQYQEIVHFIDSLQTTDEKLLFQKAEAFRKMGNMSDAIVCLKGICENTKDVEMFRHLANYYNKISDKKQALETLKTALKVDKSNKLYYEIAKLQYALRLYDEGVAICNKVLQQDTIPNVLRLQSSLFQALDRTDEAKQLLERGISRNPKDYLSVIALAKLYKKEGDYEAILPITEAYLKQDSVNVRVLSLDAFAYFSLYKYREAKEKYEKLFELGCDPAEHYFYLGYTYYRLGQANDAYNYLFKANEFAQGLNETILYHLGLAAIKSLRYDEALDFLEKALHYYLPNNEKIEDIYTRKSSAYHSLGQDTKAIEMLRKGMKYKYKLRTLYHIAYLYDTSKREKQAVRAYNKFLKALPDDLTDRGLRSLKKYTEHRLQQIQEKQFMNRDTVSLAK